MEDGTSMPNFTPIGATCRPCGAKNLKIGLLSKLNTGRFALRAMLPVKMNNVVFAVDLNDSNSVSNCY